MNGLTFAGLSLLLCLRLLALTCSLQRLHLWQPPAAGGAEIKSARQHGQRLGHS